MSTMEITKYVGAICGSLLAFLVISTVAHAIYDTHSEEAAYSFEAEEEAAPEGAAPADAVDVTALVAAASPDAGQSVFRRCAACHKVDGSNAVGPHLDGVVGRDAGSADGFDYSSAMQAKEGAWTPAELYAFLENPKAHLPGTSMAFAGLPKAEDRTNVIAYLASVSP